MRADDELPQDGDTSDSAAKPDSERSAASENPTLAAGWSGSKSDTASTADTVDSGGASTTSGTRFEYIGQTIGRYRLLQEIGEGGFGTVYMAEQEQPVRRRVALKIIKLGMDTRQVIARFEAERQALALMDHPNIAKVLDAGTTETGRPYFVMELVNGVPITDYCNQRSMPFQERLQLFVQVCAAVQHAHQKGIIHRDIKPSNVLVTRIDDKPAPKVIDFGVAKATQARLTEQTMFTEVGQFIGTPAYMSPEQADPVGEDVDTRTDIYSLGVLLYELLTGATPFDSQSLRKAGFAEIKRILREQDPPRPSTRLSQHGEQLERIARQRATDPRKFGTVLRGDLDWIIMKALEKDRARRYESASGLATDIERYMTGEPVLAAPPSTSYRFRKFVRRNKGVVIAAGTVAAALILGLAGTLWQARIAAQQRDLARGEAARAVAAEAQARNRAADLQKVADFQGEMLNQVDATTAGLRLAEDVRARFDAALRKAGTPDEERTAQTDSFSAQWGRVNVTDAARELIDRTILQPTVAGIDAKFSDQPSIAATLRHVLAKRYHSLGLDQAALQLEERALADWRRIKGEEHPDTLGALSNLGVYLGAIGRRKDAEPIYRDALLKSRRVFGDDNAETLVCLDNLAGLLIESGDFTEAESCAREALERRRRVFGEQHPDTLRALRQWAGLLKAQGKLKESEAFYREVLEKRRITLGQEDRDTLSSLNDLADVLHSLGKLDEAIGYFREATEKYRHVLGEAHPVTLSSIQSLGATLGAAGQSVEAEALLREALNTQRKLLGADHSSTLTTMGNLCVNLIGQNKFAEAEPLCRETLERRRRTLGENHNSTLIATNVMGLVLVRQKKLAEGEPYWREALAIAQRVLGPAHPETLVYTHNLGGLAIDQNQPEQAEKLFRDVIQNGTPTVGAEHPTVLASTRRFATLLLKQKRFSEADQLLSAAEPAARKTYKGSTERNLGSLLMNLGAARAGLEHFAAAEANYLDAYAIFANSRSPARGETLECVQALVDLYSTWERAEPESGHEARSREWRLKLDTPATSQGS